MTEESTPIALGLGEIVVSRNAAEVLVIYGLGSCVGIGMFDPVNRVAGMLHAVLPSGVDRPDVDSGRYVDSGIDALICEMMVQGGVVPRCQVWMVGGASMMGESYFDIGRKNIAKARSELACRGLALSGEEVGGNVGRTMRIFVGDGRMTISQVHFDPELMERDSNQLSP